MAMASNEQYIVVPRQYWYRRDFTLYADALAFAVRQTEPVDIHHSTGRVCWVWEQRP